MVTAFPPTLPGLVSLFPSGNPTLDLIWRDTTLFQNVPLAQTGGARPSQAPLLLCEEGAGLKAVEGQGTVLGTYPPLIKFQSSKKKTPLLPTMLVVTVHGSLTLWGLKTPSCVQPPSSFQGKIH